MCLSIGGGESEVSKGLLEILLSLSIIDNLGSLDSIVSNRVVYLIVLFYTLVALFLFFRASYIS